MYLLLRVESEGVGVCVWGRGGGSSPATHRMHAINEWVHTLDTHCGYLELMLTFAILQIYYPVSKNYIEISCVYCNSN